jgi:ribosomal protein L44E
MATTSDRADERSEYCPTCDRETAHAVSLQIVTESENMDNAQFSREPYRVTECQVCGETDAVRMNNA